MSRENADLPTALEALDALSATSSSQLDESSPLPIGLPAAHTTNVSSYLIADISAASAPRKYASASRRNHPPTASLLAHSNAPLTRFGRNQLDRLSRQLSERDFAVLEAVSSYRFIATRQLHRLLFSDHATPVSGARTTRRVLRRLAHHGVLRSLERRVGGFSSGSEPSIWTLSEAGHRMLEDRALSEGRAYRRRRFHEPSQRLLEHCLATTEVALVVHELALAGRAIETVTLEPEPESWRRYDSYGGGRQLLKPDLAAVTVATSDGETFEDRWFFEVDMGNQHPATLLKKCREYTDYRATGIEQAAHDVFPLVVWVMRSDEQCRRLIDVIATAQDLDPRLFRVVTEPHLGALVTGGAA